MAKLAAGGSTVVAFRPGASGPVPEVAIAVAKRGATVSTTTTCEPGVDLSGKPRVVFLIGAGRSGKTTLARYMVERGLAAGRTPVLAALDPVNQTLVSYFPDVAHPQTPSESVGLLRELLGFVVEEKQSAVIDLGGGDTTLATVLDEMPDLATSLESAGVAPVALYMLAPRIADIAAYLQLGFQPTATAFVLNRTQEGDFRPLLEQSAIKAAIARGARTVLMPKLEAATMSAVELNQPLSFGRAAKGELIGPWKAATVRTWLARMDQAFADVGTWLA